MSCRSYKAARIAAALALLVGLSASAFAQWSWSETHVINPSARCMGLSPDNSLWNLGSPHSSLSVAAWGDAHYGPNSFDRYGSIAIVYKDSQDELQYASVPVGGSALLTNVDWICGAFITDSPGTLGDNWGTAFLSATGVDDTGTPTGFAVSGSLSATSQVALLGGDSEVNFLGSNDNIDTYVVTARGAGFCGPPPALEYGSVMLQFLDPSGGIEYQSVPVGGTTYVTGRNIAAFLTDLQGLTFDNRGGIEVTVRPVQAPAP